MTTTLQSYAMYICLRHEHTYHLQHALYYHRVKKPAATLAVLLSASRKLLCILWLMTWWHWSVMYSY